MGEHEKIAWVLESKTAGSLKTIEIDDTADKNPEPTRPTFPATSSANPSPLQTFIISTRYVFNSIVPDHIRMSGPREGPNPLRPYYIPPSVGSPPAGAPQSTATPSVGNRNASTSTTNFGSSARNILSDIDYSDYLAEDSSSPPEVIKRLVEQALWKYMSVFLAQPFEVAKTILQVHVARIGHRSNVKDVPPEDTRRRLDAYEVCIFPAAVWTTPLTFVLEPL